MKATWTPILTPVCSGCGAVRVAVGVFRRMGKAIGLLSHTICGPCRAERYPNLRRVA